MSDINLLKDFGLSLADIHKREQPVPEESVEVRAESPAEKASPKSFVLALFGALAGLGVAAVAVFVFFKVSLVPPTVPPRVATPVDQAAGENIGGYERVQFIEFTGESLGEGEPTSDGVELLTRNTPPAMDEQAPAVTPPADKPVERTPAVIAPVEKVIAPPPVTLYALEAADLSEANYQRLRNIAEDMSVKLAASSKSPELWAVYVPAEGSDKVLQGVPVAQSDIFDSRDKAVAFAETLAGIETVFVIKTEGEDKRYSVSACCLGYEDAGLLAEKSGMDKGSYDLVKQ